jgi:hypothetical protein
MKLDPTRTYKVFHSLWYLGKNAGMFKTDLQHDEGVWYIVFEWTTNHDGGFPSIRFPAPMHDLQGTPDNLVFSRPVEIAENDDLTAMIEQQKRDKGKSCPTSSFSQRTP